MDAGVTPAASRAGVTKIPGELNRCANYWRVESRELAAICSASMPRESIKPVDILRHELKALRFILDNFHSGKLGASALPAREDFQSEQGRALYDSIVKAPSRNAAESTIAELELEDVDIDSFLHLSGEHYYTYPALVRERAAAIRTGKLTVENT